MLHFFPCQCTTVPALPRRDGGVGRYSRSALPIPSAPGLPGLSHSTGLLLLLPLVGGRRASTLGNLLCCFFRLELPLPMVVPGKVFC